MPQLKQCLGVDLGVNTVKIVELTVDKNSVRVVRAASAPTGANSAMSTDEIRAAIVSTTRDLIKKSRFSSRKAVFAISGQKVFVRRFRLPKTSDERLARIIQYEARQQIPFPLDKTYLQFQYRHLPEEAEIEVLLVAVRNDEIRDQVSLMLKVGLTPVAIGVSSFALYNGHRFVALDEKSTNILFDNYHKRKKKKVKAGKGAPVEEAKKEEVAAEDEGEFGADAFLMDEVKGYVNIGATSYDLAIGRSGQNYDQDNAMIGFSRTVPMGGDEVTRGIMRSCNIESFADAERIKQSNTQLMTYNFDFESETQINQEASMAATEVVDRMVTEIRRSLDFFITQPDGVAIDALVLSGGLAQLPGFDSYLEEKLSMPVSLIGAPQTGSPLVWNDSLGSITPYMISVGLALQGMGLAQLKVDFLPEDRKIIRDFPYKVTAVMCAIVAGTVMIASQAGEDYARKFESSSQALQAELIGNRSQNEQYLRAEQLHTETAADYDGMSKLFGQRSYWLEFTAKLAEIKPPEVVLIDLQYDHDGMVTIEGFSQAQVSAAFFRDALNEAFKGRLRPVARQQQPTAQQGMAGFGGGAPVPPPAAPREEAIIDEIVDVPNPPPPFNPPASRFKILMQMKDKQNHLQITPTPAPTPALGAGGQNLGFGPPGGRPVGGGGAVPEK